jgi:hypothetical protein
MVNPKMPYFHIIYSFPSVWQRKLLPRSQFVWVFQKYHPSLQFLVKKIIYNNVKCDNENIKVQCCNMEQTHHKNVEIFPSIWIQMVFW